MYSYGPRPDIPDALIEEAIVLDPPPREIIWKENDNEKRTHYLCYSNVVKDARVKREREREG